MVDSKKLLKFVISLANDVNDETPWQIIECWKATFPVELPLYCAVLTSAAGAEYTRLHRLCLF